MLKTTLFRKPTAVNTILRYNSFHAKPLRDSSPIASSLSLCQNCTDNWDFKQEANQLRLRLKQWGYSNSVLKMAYRQASIKSEGNSCILNQKPRKKKHWRGSLPPIAVSPNRLSFLSKYWYLLQADPVIAKYVPTNPGITFRRAKSLQDMLTRSHFEPRGTLQHCKSQGPLSADLAHNVPMWIQGGQWNYQTARYGNPNIL